MAMLVGRMAWSTALGLLSYGKIVAVKDNRVTMDTGIILGTIEIPRSNLILSKQRAIIECEEYIDYWRRKLKELEQDDP